MSTLTEYRRPRADYRAEARSGAWRPLGGWHMKENGQWMCVYVKHGGRVRQARRAVIHRASGAWAWKVEQFDLGTRAVVRTVNRNLRGTWYVSAAAAMPWADAAARTSD